MRNVVFVAPFLMDATMRFVDAIGHLPDTRVLGICQQKPEGHAPSDMARFFDLIQIPDCFNVEQVEGASREFIRRHGPIHRITNVLELIQEVVAHARERLGLPGLRKEAARRFLNKSVMKEAFEQLGVPCARHALLTDAAQGFDFAARVGYPLIVKPPVGAGCVSTFQIHNEGELASALEQFRPSPENPVQIEEFISGEEFSFDTFTINGKVVWHSICQYLPPPIEAMRNPWIQWCHMLPKDISGNEYDEIRSVGTKAVEGFGMASGITHMEWFRRRRDGSVAIGEVAARPPGAHLPRCWSYCYDGPDFYHAWALATVDDKFNDPGTRKYAVASIHFRGAGHGNVRAVEGVEEANRLFGKYVMEARLPRIGAPKSESYEGDGYAIIRADSDEELRAAIQGIISRVRVYYA